VCMETCISIGYCIDMEIFQKQQLLDICYHCQHTYIQFVQSFVNFWSCCYIVAGGSAFEISFRNDVAFIKHKFVCSLSLLPLKENNTGSGNTLWKYSHIDTRLWLYATVGRDPLLGLLRIDLRYGVKYWY